MDWRAHLARPEAVVVPWVAGPTAHTGVRVVRWRDLPPEPGWWTATVEGRLALCGERAEAPDLSALPVVRGWLSRRGEHAAQLVLDGRRVEQVFLLPVGDLPLLTPVRARRWPSGLCLFEGVEFETEAEEAARRALERGTSLEGVAEEFTPALANPRRDGADEERPPVEGSARAGDGVLNTPTRPPPQGVKGVPAGLRAAWTFARVDRVSRRLGIAASFAEVRQQFSTLATAGEPGAEAFLHALAGERALIAHERTMLHRARAAETLAAHAEEARNLRREALRRGDAGTLEERAEAALSGQGARLARCLRQGADQAEVHFDYQGERFVCLVDEATLQVRDAGICLGHPPADEELSLAALPGVIAEALATDQLVITRHA